MIQMVESIVATAPEVETSGGGGSPLVIGMTIMVGVLLFGLAAIARQRKEGRRSKLPPMG